ncbi:Tubulin gamma chain [Diplonema papillatum]|nr:Tubulin gamma chain [Diplonema papillatum]
MSILTLQVGQCGNQVGHALLARLASSPDDDGCLPDEYFRTLAANGKPPVARSVLVDMEPKAVQNCRNKARQEGTFSYRKGTLTKQEGSANNWAFGYHVQAVCCEEQIMKDVQSEVEHMDALMGIHVVHAVAGGTGSGVGSRVLEALRDTFPSTSLVAMSVLPIETGEIATQHYNSLLTLAHVQQVADACVALDNTTVMQDCRRAKLGSPQRGVLMTGDAETVSFDEVNGAISLLGVNGYLGGAAFSEAPRRVRLLDDFVRAVAPVPCRKFASLFGATATTADSLGSWNAVLQNLSRQSPSCAACPSLLTIRGPLEKRKAGLSKVDHADPSSLFGDRCKLATGKLYAAGAGSASGPRSSGAFLAVNSKHPVAGKLSFVASRVAEMLSCDAYLHHFQRYGLEKDDCEAALTIAHQVVKDYNAT